MLRNQCLVRISGRQGAGGLTCPAGALTASAQPPDGGRAASAAPLLLHRRLAPSFWAAGGRLGLGMGLETWVQAGSGRCHPAAARQVPQSAGAARTGSGQHATGCLAPCFPGQTWASAAGALAGEQLASGAGTRHRSRCRAPGRRVSAPEGTSKPRMHTLAAWKSWPMRAALMPLQMLATLCPKCIWAGRHSCSSCCCACTQSCIRTRRRVHGGAAADVCSACKAR